MDKSKSLNITLPESIYDELKDLSFSTEQSASHVIATALKLQLPSLKKHPLLLRYMDFEAVKLQLVDNSKPA